MSTMIRQKTYVTIFIILLGLTIFSQTAQAYSLTMTQKDLQTMTDVWFPVKQATAIGDVELSSPKIMLTSNSDRIKFAVNIRIEMPGEYIATGKGVIDGELDYSPERGEFYLREPHLIQLAVDGLPPLYDEMVLSIMNDLTQQLPLIVVYRLDKQTTGHAPLLRTLKSVRVHKGQLLVELGL